MECLWERPLLQRFGALPDELLHIIQHGNDHESLQSISLYAVDSRFTNLLFAFCGDIFAHICATMRSFATLPDALATIARIIPLAPHLSPFAERLLSSEKYHFSHDSNYEEDLKYLLALYRLIQFDHHTFRKYITPAHLSTLLRHSQRPFVYLAIRILQFHLHGSDDWFEQMVYRYLGADTVENNVTGPWDTKNIDYRFLSLWEEERIENLQKLFQSAKLELEVSSRHDVRVVRVECFHPSVSLVGSTLLPRADVHTEDVPSSSAPFVHTSTTFKNLRKMGCALKSPQPLILTGTAGSGKTRLVRHAAQKLGELERLVTLHLNEQTDAKSLIGIYTTGENPGSFVWKPGVLTTAVFEGRWVLLEDLDKAPNDLIATLIPLIERREVFLPNRKQTVRASPGFRIIATARSLLNNLGDEKQPLARMQGAQHWQKIFVETPSVEELGEMAADLFPALSQLIPQLISVYERLLSITKPASPNYLRKSAALRPISSRDFFKWCKRVVGGLPPGTAVTSQQFDRFFLEAIDCFTGSSSDGDFRSQTTAVIAEELRIDPQRRDHLLYESKSLFHIDETEVRIGRYSLYRQPRMRQIGATSKTFSLNPHSNRILERIAAAITNREPLLLVGETGVGKTTALQYLADQVGKSVIAFNLSQQSEVGDLLGGFKPVTPRTLMVPLQDEFDELFSMSFSKSKNERFISLLQKNFAKENWKTVCKLWQQALEMVEKQREKFLVKEGGQPTKKRKLETKTAPDLNRWNRFAKQITSCHERLLAGSEAFAFRFVEGNVVKAVRNGDWILLDEINLASAETLESLADLLDNEAPSLFLTEGGGIERINAHPAFRIFAAMNPATDIGKKDLPPGIRSRFTEVYVESPDKDSKSLQDIIRSYLRHEASTDPSVISEVGNLYQKILTLVEENILLDGTGQKPQYSLRTLTRTLTYARHITPLCNLRRALYEGFQMSFITLLDAESSNTIRILLEQHLLGKRMNISSELSKTLRKPAGDRHVQGFPGSKHWVQSGVLETEDQAHYILTPFIRTNMENLVRATSIRQFPVLIQGPTSSGKTSMIEYLAKRTGNKFVRINNHEFTDLQEYLGTYVTGNDGQLSFQEGILVNALREGHWLVLDELNLAPTDVLEALNRLLDDNRELFIPETQNTVRPHENFMLFATQNPAGLYGGRKPLSRAFRNRFVELYFDDIPINELEEILHRRTQLPESRCKRVVSVYRELSLLRQQTRLFEQKSFATLRDLFRWALRPNETIDQLAANGFMLLAERVRKPEERTAIKEIIERIMSKGGPRVRIDETTLYSKDSQDIATFAKSVHAHDVVWTKAMCRLYKLVARALHNNEPVLLVGETGCGKTTVCQMIANAAQKTLYAVNAHQNTETGDLIGSQRPLRNRESIVADLRRQLLDSPLMQKQSFSNATTTEALLAKYDEEIASMETTQRAEYTHTRDYQTIQASRARSKALFEWGDGSLIEAMKEGAFFLLDEISLADDSVLERLNSVLEPGRSILLAEKGSLDSLVEATPGFQFLATMNPGGDYGKRELSPALRNRFTEIWVPNLSDDEDIVEIVHYNLVPDAKPFSSAIKDFAQWFKYRYNTAASATISIRDILTWSGFINTCSACEVANAVVHGAAMVFIDTLGANPAGLITSRRGELEQERNECLRKLEGLLGFEPMSIYSAPTPVSMSDDVFKIGPFEMRRHGTTKRIVEKFSFDAPTTRKNAMRVMRALQLPKPVMIEGSPGVGKTALVSAIADAVDAHLIRINLSEQTDLIDLFGADAPMEGAEVGMFAWRDAPFLTAMQSGHWVLLDEMNLASQSVLEGLNACLDHRGEVYIPELGKTFSRHPDFRLFAAQNPHHQGGGRKGLPASFVNRFTVVYADSFSELDYSVICRERFPDVDSATIQSVVKFVESLEDACSNSTTFGSYGGPWEFNLRDIFRWLELLSSGEMLLKSASAKDIAEILFSQRFRSDADKAFVDEIFASVFPDATAKSDMYSVITARNMQLGLALLPRNPDDCAPPVSTMPKLGSKAHLRLLHSIMISIHQRWPVLLTGSSGAGKTVLIERLAAALGASLVTMTMSVETDTMDFIGGYEQPDVLRKALRSLEQLRMLLHSCARNGLLRGDIPIDNVLKYAPDDNLESYDHSTLVEIVAALPKDLHDIATGLLESIEQHRHAVDRGKFDWVNGTLIDAISEGRWLVLDHANLASSSVLDRLNSLLEPDGCLFVNEHSDQDGFAKIIRPHPNFRIFLTMDPRYGELSHAMRNRSVEFYLPLPDPTNCPSLDPIDTESSVARFRHFKTLKSCDYARMETISSIFTDHLAFSDQGLLQRFESQLMNGLYGDDIQQYGLHMTQPVQLANLARITEELYDPAVSQMRLPAEFSHHQSFHPLNNQSLVYWSNLTLHKAVVFGFMYDIGRNLIYMGNVLRSIEADSDAQLNIRWVEKSFHFGNSAGMDVLSLLRRIREIAMSWMQSCTMATRSNIQPIKTSLRQLCTLWTVFAGLVRTRSLETANLRICLALVRKILRGWTEIPSLDTNGEKWLSFIPEDSWTGGRGVACTTLWRETRPSTPISEDSMKSKHALKDMAYRFDDLCGTFEIPVDTVVKLRRSFQNALSLEIFDKSGLIDLSTTVETLTPPVQIAETQRMPLFLETFQLLHQQFTFLALVGQLQISQDVVELETFSRLSINDSIVLPAKSLSVHEKMRLLGISNSTKVVENGAKSELQETWERHILQILKCREQTKLRDLDLLKMECRPLRRLIALNTDIRSNGELEKLDKCLYNLTTELLTILGKSEHLWLQDYARQLLRQLSQGQESALIDQSQLFVTKSDAVQIPAQVSSLSTVVCYLKMNDKSSTQQAMAPKSWIALAKACLYLYVPANSFDPAIEPHIIEKMCKINLDDLTDQLSALQIFKNELTGDADCLRRRLIKSEITGIGGISVTDKVHRPHHSQLTQLQSELDGLVRLLSSHVDSKVPLDKTIYTNLLHFKKRLREQYKAYEDFVSPIVGFIDCLLVGHYVALKQRCLPREPTADKVLARVLPFAEASAETWSEDDFFVDALRHVDLWNDTSLVLRVILHRSSIRPVKDSSQALRDALDQQFLALYQLWRTQLSQDQKQHAIKSSIYKFKANQDEDGSNEDDLKELFPGTVEPSGDFQPLDQQKHIQDHAATIASLHFGIYSSEELDTGAYSDLLCEWACSNSWDSSTVDTDSLFPTIIISLSQLNADLIGLTRKARSYNFYSDPNIPESESLRIIVNRVRLRFSQISASWPEHATPIEVMRVCDHLDDASHCAPLSRFLPTLELLHFRVNEWQEVASRDFSVLDVREVLTSLIIKWRQMELSSWAGLFDRELEQCKKNAASWWFVAYETIIAAANELQGSVKDLQQHATALLQSLSQFLSLSGLGEFNVRLRLLRGFEQHLASRAAHEPRYEILRSALSNFIEYYAEFEGGVFETLRNGRAEIETEIKNVIQLASWKDRNIEVLRESARSSHKKLLKSIKKFRKLLAQPVTSTLLSGVPVKHFRADKTVLDLDLDFHAPAGPAPVFHSLKTWTHRALRFQSFGETLNIMQIKLKKSLSSINESTGLQEFCNDLTLAILELQKATPSNLTEQNKALVTHLKARKRRLLAEVLKSVRSMGFQHTISQNILDRQSSIEALLASTRSLLKPKTGKEFISAEYEFHRFIQIMPSVRECRRKASEELTAAEVTRCASFLESMLHAVCLQRDFITKYLPEYASLSCAIDQLGNFANCQMPKVGKFPEGDRSSTHFYFASMEPALRFAIDTLQAQSELAEKSFEETVNALKQDYAQLSQLSAAEGRMARLPTGIEDSVGSLLEAQVTSHVQNLTATVENAGRRDPETLPVLSHLLKWIPSRKPISHATPRPFHPDLWIQQLLDTIDIALGSVQDISDVVDTAIELKERRGWVIAHQETLEKILENTHLMLMTEKLEGLLSSLRTLGSSSDSLISCVATICKYLHPLLEAYCKLARYVVQAACGLHEETNKTGHKLAQSFVQLASHGFCTPAEKLPDDDGQKGDIESGTGLGEGEGAEDISKDIEDDEDLSELAQQSKSEQSRDQESKGNEKDAVDMADEELEGELDNGSEEDGSGNDVNENESDKEANLDEEVSEGKDLGPSKVDEKLWESGKEEANAKDDRKSNSVDEGDIGNDDTAKDTQESRDKEESKNKQDSNESQIADEETEKIDGERSNPLDQSFNDQETLQLPEEMDMGTDETMDDIDSEVALESDDTGSEVESVQSAHSGTQEARSTDNGSEQEYAGQSNENKVMEDVEQAEGCSDVMQSDTVRQDVEDHTGPTESWNNLGPATTKNETEDSGDGQQAPEDGEKKGQDESNDAGPAGGQNDVPGGDSLVELAEVLENNENQPFKQLGDMLDEWYRQSKRIQDAEYKQDDAHDLDQQPRSSEELAGKQLQHLPDQDAAADGQALGTTSANQSSAMDEEQAISVDEEEMTLPSTPPARKDSQNEKSIDNSMHLEAPETALQEIKQSARFHSWTDIDGDADMIDEDQTPETAFEDVDEQLMKTHISNNDATEPMSADEARQKWSNHEHNTRTLALLLTEHLRLILHPTRATKMRGDYRTGKRLNIKKIIPYIASSYKRDKIWMRRTVPSKRAYQIMLAIDDSESMNESATRELAFETLTLVMKSMSMLEVGELSVVAFGEQVKVAQDFRANFDSEAGSEVLRHFGFSQRRTDVYKLLVESLRMLKTARMKAFGSGSDLWQLQLIISDGICEDHASIRRLVREAHNDRIMIVFIVLDAISTAGSTKQSILDLQSAEFVKDEVGEMQLKMVKYLDSFPFRYYLIVHDIQELPGILSSALRQWFAEVSGSE